MYKKTQIILLAGMMISGVAGGAGLDPAQETALGWAENLAQHGGWEEGILLDLVRQQPHLLGLTQEGPFVNPELFEYILERGNDNERNAEYNLLMRQNRLEEATLLGFVNDRPNLFQGITRDEIRNIILMRTLPERLAEVQEDYERYRTARGL
ncbi:MAG: hypothetical protein LBJ70_05935 [Holosporales bacterium]|jgi:hypothetical protein|nr:hypothetical protein [Holosporales bacterium]